MVLGSCPITVTQGYRLMVEDEKFQLKDMYCVDSPIPTWITVSGFAGSTPKQLTERYFIKFYGQRVK